MRIMSQLHQNLNARVRQVLAQHADTAHLVKLAKQNLAAERQAIDEQRRRREEEAAKLAAVRAQIADISAASKQNTAPTTSQELPNYALHQGSL